MVADMILDGFKYFRTSDGARLRYGNWFPEYRNGRSFMDVIIFQGRASFIEKFDAAIEGLLERGYGVWAFDWRGQGMSSRMLDDARKGHINTYDTYLRDFDEFLNMVVMPVSSSRRLIVLGQSMGSHLALRYMADHANVFDLAVLTSPLIDLKTGGYPKNVARMLANVVCKAGFGESLVWLYDPSREPFEGNMMTHNRSAFLYHRSLQRMFPELMICGSTYQWLKATFDSIDFLMQEDRVRRIYQPAMIISAGQEVLVDNSRLETLVSWLPKGIHLKYPGARHQILAETPGIMKMFWDDFDRFVKYHLSLGEIHDLPESRFVKPSQFSGMDFVYSTSPNNL